jgi:hypothetical protein
MHRHPAHYQTCGSEVWMLCDNLSPCHLRSSLKVIVLWASYGGVLSTQNRVIDSLAFTTVRTTRAGRARPRMVLPGQRLDHVQVIVSTFLRCIIVALRDCLLACEDNLYPQIKMWPCKRRPPKRGLATTTCPPACLTAHRPSPSHPG